MSHRDFPDSAEAVHRHENLRPADACQRGEVFQDLCSFFLSRMSIFPSSDCELEAGLIDGIIVPSVAARCEAVGRY